MMQRFVGILILSLFLGELHIVGLQAAELSSARDALQTDLKQASEELGRAHETIAREKIPKVQRIQGLESEIQELTRGLQDLRSMEDASSVGLDNLRNEVEAREKELDYVLRLMDDYALFFETRVHIAELSEYQPVLDAGRTERETAPAREGEFPGFQARFSVLEASLGRLDALLGGRLFEGRALLPDGRLVQGGYALVGPMAFFAGSEADAVGVAELEANSLEAVLRPVLADRREGIQQLVNSGTGMVPLDVTGGKAWLLDGHQESLSEHILKGGVVMVPILLLAVLSLLVGLVKWIRLSGIQDISLEGLDQLLTRVRARELPQAQAQAEAIRGPVGEMLALAVRHAREDKELLEEMLIEKIMVARSRLEKTLPFMALTAAISPLLGLLGTVIGMIHTFKLITLFGTGDARTLSSGISEALITTEYGLVVAVGALVFHALLSRRVKGVISGMERTAIGFVNGVSLDRSVS